MNELSITDATPRTFDLFRLTKSKEVVDLASNTLRKLHREGRLRFYRAGKAVFVSKSELEALIRQHVARPSKSKTHYE